jgi:hypothetical protein
MNDQRASKRRCAKFLTPKLHKPLGGRALKEPRVSRLRAGRPGVLGCWLAYHRTGESPDPVAQCGALLADERNRAAHQSRLNTTEASQPVMTAIIAVTTP